MDVTLDMDLPEDGRPLREQVEEKLKGDEDREAKPAAQSSPLYASIHAIYGKVVRLKQTQLNKHGGYEFTPADDYRDIVRKLLFDHMLIDRMSEVYSSQAGEGMKTGTLKFQFEFWIMHVESGEVTDKVLRSVFLPYVGSQTASIASTFAWKEFVRSEFNMSTGEVDPLQSMGDADSRTGAKLSDTESEEVTGHLSDSLETLINGEATKEILDDWKDKNQPSIDSINAAHYQKIKAVFVKAHKAAK